MARALNILLLLLFSAPLQAAPASDSEKVRRAIDNICGDTWCEGEFVFQFKKVVLDEPSQETQVYFNMALRGFSPQVETGDGFESNLERARFDVSCKVKGFAKAEQILANDYTVKWEFYTALSNCVFSLEKKMRDLSNTLYGA